MADTKTAKSEEVEEKANAVESEAQVDTSKICLLYTSDAADD